MQIDLSTPLDSICLHPILGPGRLRVNYRAPAYGTSVRVIQVAFLDKAEWQYLPESEDYLEILPPTNSPMIGSA